MRYAYIVVLSLILVFIQLICAPVALAHKVNVFAASEGDSVLVEGYFPDGRPAESSAIEVYNMAGEKSYYGKTDSDGLWLFKPVKRENLKIVIIASLGHRNEYLLSADELPESLSAGVVKQTVKQVERKPEAQPRKQRPTRHEQTPWQAILAGLGFIFGLTSLIISLSNSRKLKERCEKFR